MFLKTKILSFLLKISYISGTRLYCPPEWFKRLTYKPIEATVWSLGIILYVMVSGYLPFQNEIQICLGRFTTPKHISKGLLNFYATFFITILIYIKN